MVETITREIKKEGQKKVKRHNSQEQKKGRKLVPFMVGSYLTHCPSNVTCMQIVRFNNNGRSKQASPAKAILLFIVEVKAH
jgi:hypothetical protein